MLLLTLLQETVETMPVALLFIQAIIPLLLPVVTKFLKSAISSLDGAGALYVNLFLNVVAQLIAALMGADPVVGVALAASGGLAGSKLNDMAKHGVDPVVYARPKK